MRTIKTIGVVLLTAAGLGIGTGVAAAHVSVSSPDAAAGGYGVLTFRVPNESDTAGTVKLAVTIPGSTPLASVRYRAVPGWTAQTVTSTLPTPVTQEDLEITEAITSVTFTADSGTRIAPGEFAEFDLSVGPLPDVAALSFPTTQTYDDGEVVEWADPVTEGAAEPEHPAPTLALTGETTGDHHGGAEVSAAPVSDGSVTQASVDHTAATSDTTARVLSVVGLVIAAAAVLVAAIALRRRPTAARPAVGPTTAGPAAAGPTAAGPTAAGPTAAGPTAAGPTATGPDA